MARFVAPGRVNLMGDHTDYNEGFVLPLAIGLGCTVTVTPADGPTLRASSRQLPGAVSVAADGHDDPATIDPPWGRFVGGVARTLSERGMTVPGAELTISSTVPPGSGLSSSSALSVALTMALADLAGAALDRVDLARLALAAEVAATGVPGGLMDQLASLLGRAGHALLIDCRSTDATPVPIARQVAVIVVHSGVPRTLAGTAYATRRAECEAAAQRIGVRALRDATPEQVADDPRARHVVTENARVRATAAALPAGDLSVLGPLLLASHASLRDDYEVSTPELDLLVELLVESGAAGARLTGAGFGGCVVALAQRNHADDVVAKTVLRYRARIGIEPFAFVAHAVDGARRDD
ncbi:MAG: galactokinase [Acidimicrobiia bacterium]